jgi:hypothetical protein
VFLILFSNRKGAKKNQERKLCAPAPLRFKKTGITN